MNLKTALLVIDVQNAMFLPEFKLYQADQILANIQGLIKKARKSGTTVIYIQHTSPEGLFAIHKPTWEIHNNIKPLPSDAVIQKTSWDSFHKTDLQQELHRQGIERLVIAGMQTEFCLDTTARRAYSMGYEHNILVQDAHSTFDSKVLPAAQIIAHHNNTLGGRFVWLELTDHISF